MKKRALALLFGLLALAPAAAAQEPVPPATLEPPILVEPPITIEPPMPPERFPGLRIEYQRVDVVIRDQVATTRIDQKFVNQGDQLLEGNYLFPLPAGAAVSELTMWVDGQAIEAKILRAEEARAIYNRIVSQLRDPALLEYVSHDAIQANVFPIPARAERRIEIEYSYLLTAENGLFRFVYPQSNDIYTSLPLGSQSIRVEVESAEAIRAIYSPSHAVAIQRQGDFRATAGYEASDVRPQADFELYYSVNPEAIGLNLLSYRAAGEDGFFVLLVAPPLTAEPDQVVARDLILVLDTSGSMQGEKMQQARQAAAYVVEKLNAEDRFNVVAFNTGVTSLAPGLLPAGERAAGLAFIQRLEALGGTNISGALLEAAAMVAADRPTTILFLTDGLATEGITETPLLLDTLQAQMPANARLFAFGVGHDVDTSLLDSLAQNHAGAASYVRPGEPIDEAVSGFYAKVSTPVLANINLDFGGVQVEQLFPQRLPDLFAGSQLVLTGRYRAGGPATITLSGEVNGREQVYAYPDNTFRDLGGDAFIPRLWATRAIGHWLTEIRLGGENPELVESIVALSLRYGIITLYTSYL
ncbi:MAG: VIT domain-containing protein, partial [Candidatus Promineifilaceae bacterium]